LIPPLTENVFQKFRRCYHFNLNSHILSLRHQQVSMKLATFPHFLISTFKVQILHSPSFNNMLYSNSWQLYLLSPSILFLLLFYSSLFYLFFSTWRSRKLRVRSTGLSKYASLQDGFRQASQYHLRALHSSDGDTLSHHTYIAADTFRSVFYWQQSYRNTADFNYIYEQFVIIYELQLYSNVHYYNLLFFSLTALLFKFNTHLILIPFFGRVSLHFRNQTCWIAYKSNSDCLAEKWSRPNT